MKKLKPIGKTLSRNELKTVNGGQSTVTSAGCNDWLQFCLPGPKANCCPGLSCSRKDFYCV